jgi:hypothetical protein
MYETTPTSQGNVPRTDIDKDYSGWYHVRDFFRPTFGESVLMGAEALFVSPWLAGVGYFVTDNNTAAIAIGAVPQALTYIGFRAAELGVFGIEYRDKIRTTKAGENVLIHEIKEDLKAAKKRKKL